MFIKNSKKKQPVQKGCRSYLGGTIVVIVIILICIVYQLVSTDWSFLEIDRYFITVDESEIVTDKIDSVDMANASLQLYEAGLSSFQYAFNYTNYNGNTDTPTSNATLSSNQFGALLDVLVKEDLDETISILQLEVTSVDEVITLRVIFCLNLEYNGTTILTIPNKIYVTEIYQLVKESTTWSILYLDGTVHNINYELEGADQLVENLDANNILQECILMWLNGTETKNSIIQTLNFTNIEFANDTVVLVQ